MLNICAQCGEYRPDKIIDPAGPLAICPLCGHAHCFARLPLLLVGGASGTGKSTICQALASRVTEAMLLDADILWRPEFDKPAENYRDFFETWLRVCKNIAQSGRPVVLFGAGIVVPENMENCVERRYFSQLHYLALVCDDQLLATRLRARGDWRRSAQPAFIETQIGFNRWLKVNAATTQPAIELYDTSQAVVTETAEYIHQWIRSIL